MTLELGDPTVSAAILRAIDERIAAALERRLPIRGYGVVASVAPASATAAIYIKGQATSSPGFRYEVNFAPVVGNLVRYVIDGGDRYIEAVYTAGGARLDDSLLIRSAAGHANLELRSATAGFTPHIDFVNDDTTDFDARLILTSDNDLALQGANLVLDADTTLTAAAVNPSYLIQVGTLPGNLPYGMSMCHVDSVTSPGWPGSSGLVVSWRQGNTSVLQLFVTDYTGAGPYFRHRNDSGGWTGWSGPYG